MVHLLRESASLQDDNNEENFHRSPASTNILNVGRYQAVERYLNRRRDDKIVSTRFVAQCGALHPKKTRTLEADYDWAWALSSADITC
jgi:hypothetical protein